MNTPEHRTLEADLMSQTRDPFGLASLPEVKPQKDRWMAISVQLQRQRRRQQWLSGLALAASVTLVLGVVSIVPQLAPQTGPQAESKKPTGTETLAQQSATQPDEVIEPATAGPDLGPENLQSLQRLSQRLEQNLSYLRTGVGAMPAELVVYQVELEDLVAQVDAAISLQPESSELWQQRVSLLMDLNQIYGDSLRREDPYVASL